MGLYTVGYIRGLARRDLAVAAAEVPISTEASTE